MKPERIEGSTILLVEDEESLAIGLEYNLTEEGYRVIRAADGAEALERGHLADQRNLHGAARAVHLHVMLEPLDAARDALAPLYVPELLENGEVVAHAVGRRDVGVLPYLADGRRAVVLPDGLCDEVEDLFLGLGVIVSHLSMLSCSMNRGGPR